MFDLFAHVLVTAMFKLSQYINQLLQIFIINYWNLKFVGHLGRGLRVTTAKKRLPEQPFLFCTNKLGIIIEQLMGDFKEVYKVYHEPFISISHLNHTKIITYHLLQHLRSCFLTNIIQYYNIISLVLLPIVFRIPYFRYWLLVCILILCINL